MVKLLVVKDERARASVPELQGFEIERVDVRDAAAKLNEECFDVVIVHVGADGHVAMNAVNAVVPLVGRHREVPVLVTADEPTPATAVLLRASLVEGYVDLFWTPELLAASIVLHLRSVRTERRALDAQAVYLNAALGDAERLQALAFRDDLTLLSNRRNFERVIDREHARCERFRASYALVFVDLDNLKEVNSTHGHLAGGQVLEQVGQHIGQLTRKCDFAFRFGGDEFVVLLVDTDEAGAMVYGERLCAGIGALRLSIAGKTIRVTASVGVSAYQREGEAAQDVLRNADAAVYAAKERGKSCVVAFSSLPPSASPPTSS